MFACLGARSHRHCGAKAQHQTCTSRRCWRWTQRCSRPHTRCGWARACARQRQSACGCGFPTSRLQRARCGFGERCRRPARILQQMVAGRCRAAPARTALVTSQAPERGGQSPTQAARSSPARPQATLATSALPMPQCAHLWRLQRLPLALQSAHRLRRRSHLLCLRPCMTRRGHAQPDCLVGSTASVLPQILHMHWTLGRCLVAHSPGRPQLLWLWVATAVCSQLRSQRAGHGLMQQRHSLPQPASRSPLAWTGPSGSALLV